MKIVNLNVAAMLVVMQR